MSEILVNITRSNIVESIYRGDVVVVDYTGKILLQIGDPFKFTYWRSAAKPIQALNVILSGAADKYSFSNKELAIICSSHYAEPEHLEAVTSILNKIGLSEKNILGGNATSLKYDYALELASKGFQPSPILSDCSGKHAGMLAVCVHKNYNLSNYLDPLHPCQREILENISIITKLQQNEIKIGIDGCSAPVHALPLYNMALAYAQFAKPEDLQPNIAAACTKIFEAMTSEPFMIAGTGGFCTELIKNSNQKLIGKVGAEGVYCVGIKDIGIGIAVKIESGSMTVLPPVVLKILEHLKILNNTELASLQYFRRIENKNDNNITVGYIECAFDW